MSKNRIIGYRIIASLLMFPMPFLVAVASVVGGVWLLREPDIGILWIDFLTLFSGVWLIACSSATYSTLRLMLHEYDSETLRIAREPLLK